MVKKINPFSKFMLTYSVIFLSVLLLLEAVITAKFTQIFAEEIDKNKRERLLNGWNGVVKYLSKLHEAKITGYFWWTELGENIQVGNYNAVFQTLFRDMSLKANYSIFMILDAKGNVVYGSLNGIDNRYHLKFNSLRCRKIEREAIRWFKKTKLSVFDSSKPIARHMIFLCKNKPMFVTFSPICNDIGSKIYNAVGIIGTDLNLKIIGDILQYRITISQIPDKSSYLSIPVTKVQNDLFVNFYPYFPTTQLTSKILFNALIAYVIASVIIFLLVSPIFVRKQIKKLEQLIEERTSELNQKHITLIKEMEMAKALQKNLVGPSKYEDEFVNIFVHWEPVEHIGGDYYDIFTALPSGLVGVLIVDAVGHGVPAALISAMIRISFFKMAKEHILPGKVLTEVNKELAEHFSPKEYFTSFYIVLDKHKKEMFYSGGGHRPALIINRKTKHLEKMNSQGGILGSFVNSTYQTRSRKIVSGDKIILYTDGLVEAKNIYGEEYGEHRLINKTKELVNLNPQDMVNRIIEDVKRFTYGRELTDDCTLIAIEVK